MKFLSRRLVMPADLNSRGTLFGGRLLAWIDEEASVYAAIEAGADLVLTKYISEMDFQNPALLGDVVEIGMEIIDTTRVTITLRCTVRELRSKRDIVKIDRLVFVAIDEHGRPTRHKMGPGCCETDAASPQAPYEREANQSEQNPQGQSEGRTHQDRRAKPHHPWPHQSGASGREG